MVFSHFARIKTFLTIARENSFSKAAVKLAISQPAATQHIQLLEKAVEMKLFKRSREKIVLTEEGKRFYVLALEVEKAYKSAESKIALRFFKNEWEETAILRRRN